MLQILQSEKIIRVRSLIEQGFDMAEVQNIFTSMDDSDKTDADTRYLSELITFQIDSFQFHPAVDQNNTSIIFYVAGAILRTLLKNIQFDKIDSKQVFTAYVPRGGLMKPSDVVYITCTLAYAACESIKNCDEVYQFLVNSSDPRNVFVK